MVVQSKLLGQEDVKEEVHEASGSHLLVTLRGCADTILNDAEALKELTAAAAAATGATVLQTCSQKFSPQGVTTVAILAESHASLHTYPEANVVFWDCFTCGTKCVPEKSIDILKAALQPESLDTKKIERC